MIKAYQYQLRLKGSQQASFKRWSGALRWLWNKAIGEQQAHRARGEKYANYAQMCKWLTVLRGEPATAWLAEGPLHPQQQLLKRLDAAYQRFFKKAGGYPKFKRYGDDPGMRFPDAKQVAYDPTNERIKLPKVGWVRLRLSRPIEVTIRNVSVRREGARWYASIQTLQGDVAPSGDLKPTIGLDLGINVFAAGSNGLKIEPLNAYKLHQCRLRRYQRSVSRKVKGSSNRKKAIQKLGNLHRKIARMRSDWLNKLTTVLVNDHPVIALEDLKVSNMSRSAKGTAEEPGKRVRQKARLNRGILDQAWGEFARQLQYKAQALGGAVVYVNPAYSSQGCNVCGHVDKANRKTQESFLCMACGHAENADIHAAKNILQRGLAVWNDTHTGGLNRQQHLAAGHAASVCGENVRRQRVSKPDGAVSCQHPYGWAGAKQKPTEEVAHA
jgi:putative transposase